MQTVTTSNWKWRRGHTTNDGRARVAGPRERRLGIAALCAISLLPTHAVRAGGLTCESDQVVMISVGPGPEDFAWDSTRSRLLISSVFRTTKNKSAGRIQALTIPVGEAPTTPRRLVKDLILVDRPVKRPIFYPVGLSLVANGSDTLLYVIVSGGGVRGPHAIEKFRVEDDRLVFQDLFESTLLIEPNDVLALPGDELYVSNASGHYGVKRVFEQLFKKRWSTVVHRPAGSRNATSDDIPWETVASGIGFPNGLSLGAAGGQLHVAAFNEKRLLTFQRDSETGRLSKKPVRVVSLPAHPDNLTEDGDAVVIAAHPDRKKTLANIRDNTKASPSVVYRIAADGSFHQIFADDGAKVSASSTAFIRDRVLYVSQVGRPSIAVCPLVSAD